MTANFSELLPLLINHEAHFIVIGGGAAIAHGSARLTSDVAVVLRQMEIAKDVMQRYRNTLRELAK
jgi:hypothetical protein